jgi:hypothetical protein
MTRSDSTEILARLTKIESDLGEIKLELAESRGAYRLARFVIAFFGISGLTGVTAWMMGQGK